MVRVQQGDHAVLPATHTRTTVAFTPQPQYVTAIWLVHIASTHKGMARLSGWLHTKTNVPHRELHPDMVTHPCANRARCRLTSLIETNVISLCQTTTIKVTVTYICMYVMRCSNTISDKKDGQTTSSDSQCGPTSSTVCICDCTTSDSVSPIHNDISSSVSLCVACSRSSASSNASSSR